VPDAKMDVLTLYNILEDEADEKLLLIANCLREEDKEMFTERSREGCFNILVERRLIDNETRFRAYFRVSFELFNYILNYIKDDIRRRPSNRIKKPISREEKLSLILRLQVHNLFGNNYDMKKVILAGDILN